MLSCNEFRKILVFLLFVSISPDLINAEIRVSNIAETNRSGGFADFFCDEAMLEVA
jgi:hypothetical protein